MKTAQLILSTINESKRVVAIAEGVARPFFVRFGQVSKDEIEIGLALLGDYNIKQVEATDDPRVFYAMVEDPTSLPDLNATLSYMKVEAR
jgi:hypothetical protein